MARLGFAYSIPDMGPAPGPNTITAFALGSGRPETYGVTLESFVDAPPSDPGSDQPRYALALDGPASAMRTMTLAGGGTVSYGTGGCQGSARRRLYGTVEASMAAAYLPQLQDGAFRGFLGGDRPYLSALRAWQTCMRTHDVSVTDPDAATNSLLRLADGASAADLARRQATMAAADVACDGKSRLRQRTNQALDRFVRSLSPQVVTQLDAVAGSLARADELAHRIVSP